MPKASRDSSLGTLGLNKKMKPLQIALFAFTWVVLSTKLYSVEIIHSQGNFKYDDTRIEIFLEDDEYKITVTTDGGTSKLDSNIEVGPHEAFLVCWDSSSKTIWWATRTIIRNYRFINSDNSEGIPVLKTEGKRYSIKEGLAKLNPPKAFVDEVQATLQ